MAGFRRSCLYSSSNLQASFFSNFSFEKTEDIHAFAFLSLHEFSLLAIRDSNIISSTFITSLTQISTSYTFCDANSFSIIQ